MTTDTTGWRGPLAALTLVVLAGCAPYGDLLLNRYDYPDQPALCFSLDGIDWRADQHQHQHCPAEHAAHEAAMRVAALAAVPRDWTVSMVDIDGPAGVTIFADRTSLVGDVLDPMQVASHELLHGALWEASGDPDYAHVDPRWEGL